MSRLCARLPSRRLCGESRCAPFPVGEVRRGGPDLRHGPRFRYDRTATRWALIQPAGPAGTPSGLFHVLTLTRCPSWAMSRGIPARKSRCSGSSRPRPRSTQRCCSPRTDRLSPVSRRPAHASRSSRCPNAPGTEANRVERWCYHPERVRRIACVSEGLRRDTGKWYPRTWPPGDDPERSRHRSLSAE
jgi:hypothetical protein